MWSYNYTLPSNELAHHGVKGMKWGVRRTPAQLGYRVKTASGKRQESEAEYRKKLNAISKNKRANTNDVKLAKYRKQSLPVRYGKQLVSSATAAVLSDVFSGNISSYANMSTVEMGKKLGKVAVDAMVNMAIQDSLAKLASKRYTSEGKRRSDIKKDGILAKEEKIATGINVATKLVPIVTVAAGMKMSQIAHNRAANEARFNQWGQNVLSEKVEHVVWQSDDLMTAVIEDSKRVRR